MVDQPVNPTTPPEGGPTPLEGDPPAPAPAVDPQPTDTPLGEGGKKALEAERKRAAELEKQLKALAPLTDLVDAIRGGKHIPDNDKTEIEKLQEQLTQLQSDNEKERLGRLRLEVATAAGLTPEQAARLQGSTPEELAADAAALKELFAITTEPGGPRRPAPDPTQGGRGAPPDLATQIAAAEKAGDWATAMQLKSQMLTTN
jgi:hypothetical protein